MKSFDIARLRFTRAKAHGNAMFDMWNALPAESAYAVQAKVERDGSGCIYVSQLASIPDDIALLLGEFLYQLRSALDACIYQAAIYATGKNPPPDEKSTEFPFARDDKEFDKLAARRLSSLPKDLQEAIRQVQPYKLSPSLTPEETVRDLRRTLGILNDLARIDRHRKLHVVGTMPVKLEPKFTFPPNVTLRSITLREPGLLKDGENLATFQLDGLIEPTPDLQVNPQLVTLPGLDEGPPMCHPSDTFPIRMQEMLNAVSSVIDVFERYF